jgi:hypothetical protein
MILSLEENDDVYLQNESEFDWMLVWWRFELCEFYLQGEGVHADRYPRQWVNISFVRRKGSWMYTGTSRGGTYEREGT